MFFFFNDTAPTEIYTLPLHAALPISRPAGLRFEGHGRAYRHVDGAAALRRNAAQRVRRDGADIGDRKSTRLNSSHGYISYAVFCLKKNTMTPTRDGRTRGSLCSLRG